VPLVVAEPNSVAASSLKEIARKLASETALQTGF
jgi:MinD-like ATPase involved in chromosome partitioning or flagellar assembly